MTKLRQQLLEKEAALDAAAAEIAVLTEKLERLLKRPA